MNDHSTLDSKLKKYAALATGITAVAGATNAQVQYTDINPDHLVTGNGDSYSLDLNNDNVVDFEFVTVSGTYSFTYMSLPVNMQYDIGLIYPGASSNSWMVNTSDTTIANLPAGSSIDPSNVFSSGSAGLGGFINFGILGTFPYGNFLGQEGFLGVRFQASGNTHYGWVRVEVTNDGKIISIKDYAYDATPNTAIVAGETGSGPVGLNEVDDFVNVFNSNNSLTVETSSNYINADLSLVSVSGKKVINQQINNSTTLLNTSEMSSGIYILSIVSDYNVYSKKVYLR